MNNRANELMSKVKQVSGTDSKTNSKPNWNTDIIPFLENNHDIQSVFGGWKPTSSGILAPLKNLFQTKIKNILVSIANPAFRKQQKFNQLTIQALRQLKQENDELRKQLQAGRTHSN